MEWILGFFSGIFGSWIFLVGIFFFAILAETKESLGWSIFLGILTVISLYFVFGLTVLSGLSWWMLFVIYTAGGLFHSLWRWFRFTSIITDRFNIITDRFNEDIEGQPQGSNRETMIRQYKRDTDYRENLDKITYWIMAWPISGAAHFLGDLVVTIQKVITSGLSGIFDSITDRARSKVKIDLNPSDS